MYFQRKNATFQKEKTCIYCSVSTCFTYISNSKHFPYIWDTVVDNLLLMRMPRRIFDAPDDWFFQLALVNCSDENRRERIVKRIFCHKRVTSSPFP